VSTGEYFSVVRLSSGSIYTFGIGSRIGTGSTSNSFLPTNISVEGAKMISTGLYHTLILVSDGKVVTFGLNNVKLKLKLIFQHGQSGVGNTAIQYSPVTIPTLSNITQVSAGYLFSIALDSFGQVFGFGWNSVFFSN
jgi:alpha-tubulin suppressor-like RCC1 family protein